MLTALIFGITPSLTDSVRQLCADFGDICVYKTLDSYRSPHEVARLLNTYCPELVFVQLAAAEEGASEERVRLVLEQIRMISPETAVVGLLPKADEAGLRTAAELGIVENLFPPIASKDFGAVVFRALDRAAGAEKGKRLSFIAAKSGSGATVTALNVAARLADAFNRKVLFLEADIYSGPVSIMLNIHPDQSVTDALDYSNQLTEPTWNQMISKVGNLDLLTASGTKPQSKPSQFSYFRLLRFAQQHYDDVVVDLPTQIDDASETLLTHSKSIYVVSTPEVTALALTRRRLYHLELRGVPDSLVGVILNRYDQVDWTREFVEQRVGCKVAAQIPNDYRAVQQSIEAGGFVDPESELGRAYTSLAATLAGEKAATAHGASKLKSFLRKLGSAAQHESTYHSA